MDYTVIVSAIVLGLSVLATLAKFLDWFIHSDPKTMVRTCGPTIPAGFETLLKGNASPRRWPGQSIKQDEVRATA